MDSRRPRRNYPWKRFWCPSDGTYGLDELGYLRDPESPYSRYLQPGVESLPALAALPCLALLGEPGSGKSNDLDRERSRTEAAAGAERVLSLDLTYTDPGRLERTFFESPKFLAWRDGDDLLYVFLDSLDECIIHHRTVASLLRDRLRAVGSDALPRLRLRIACRTPAWPRQFDAEFPALWGNGFGRYELLPLRKVDVAMACRAENVDADHFLQAVAAIEAQPLASRPITLKPLLEAFRDRRELPATRMAAFEQGALLLARESSDSRNDSGAAGRLQADERVAVAGRIAALLVLCRRNFIAPAAPVDADAIAAGALPAAAIEGGTEPVDDRQIEVDREAAAEVLASGLFSDGRAFVHLAISDYLAARHLLAHGLPSETLFRLVVDARCKVVPQLAELAGWLAAMQPEVRRLLVDTDPQALLRSDLGAADAAEKAAVTDSLLRGFARGELAEIDPHQVRDYHKLRHPTLGAQLAPFIRDRALDVLTRRFAIDVAGACQVAELQDLLASLALDRTESRSIRQAAARAMARAADDPSTRRRLLPLATGVEEDQDDQLKGLALTVLWPRDLSIAQLLPCLTRPRSEFLGSYWVFLRNQAAQAMAVEDLPAALAWAGHQAVAGDRRGLVEMIDELWLAAARRLDDPPIRNALADALSVAAIERADQLFHDREKLYEFRRLVRESPVRLPLAARMVGAMRARDTRLARQGTEVTWLQVLVHGDLFWAIDQLSAAGDTPAANHWALVVLALFQIEDPRHVDAVLTASGNPALARVFAHYLGSVALDSEQAAQQRPWHRLSQPRAVQAPVPPAPPLDEIRELLDRIESGATDAFVPLTDHLLADDGGEIASDVAQAPVWAQIDEALRNRTLAAARRFVREKGPAKRSWITADTIRSEAIASYRALVLLARFGPAWLSDQCAEFWRKWADLIVRFPIALGIGDDQPHQFLVAQALAGAPAPTIAAVRREIDEQDAGGHLFVLQRLERCRDHPALLRSLLAKVKRGGLQPATVRQLLGELVRRAVPGAAA
ncbi:MAG TPA: hypothetical protein VMW75_18335, partial [Thermoanaerobaculia bacterium]|nr:hypothetical protein [Thermoanaerobaculia bacterium]